MPVNILEKHAAAASAGGLGGALAAAPGVSFASGGGASAVPAGSPAAGLQVEVPSGLRGNTSALISPLVASSKRKHTGGGRPASALRKKSKYSPSNVEYASRIETTRGPEYATHNGPADEADAASPGTTMAAAA